MGGRIRSRGARQAEARNASWADDTNRHRIRQRARATSVSDRQRIVLTVGHSTHTLEGFIALLRQHDVTAIADVRSAPYSRFNPQFNREALARALDAEGIHYVYLGNELGGRSGDPRCYENGRIRYERVRKTKSFRRGLDRVVDGTARHRIVLMCVEKEPLDCHRTLLVSLALAEKGIKVAHVHADGHLEPQDRAMDRLLELRGLSGEDFFRDRKDRIAEAIAKQSRIVAHTRVQTAASNRKRHEAVHHRLYQKAG